MTVVCDGPAPLPWIETIVESVVPRTVRVASLMLPSVLGRIRAGQHVDLRLVAEDGYEARRSYSIASAPDSERIELMVERLDDGEVSPFLHDVVRAGDTLALRGPLGGHFVWDAAFGGPLLLVAGGSGIAPLMSMLRHRARVAPDVRALLVHGARTWDDLVYREELIEAAARDPRFTLVFATSRDAARPRVDHAGRIERAVLRDALDRWTFVPSHTYVCGSTGFVETVSGALVVEGVDAALIRTERYGGVA